MLTNYNALRGKGEAVENTKEACKIHDVAEIIARLMHSAVDGHFGLPDAEREAEEAKATELAQQLEKIFDHKDIDTIICAVFTVLEEVIDGCPFAQQVFAEIEAERTNPTGPVN